MDQDAVEARIERLFKEAKPRSRIKKGYLKLAAVLLLATIPLSVTQQPSSQPIPETPVIPAIAETQDPTITPSVLADTDKTLTITVDQPGTFFFCGCSRARVNSIEAFAQPNEQRDI